MAQSTIKFVLILTFLFSLVGCASRGTKQVKTLISEANLLMADDTKLQARWLKDYAKTFAPENRAQFPENRQAMRTSGEGLVKLIDESSQLNERIAEKFDQAAWVATSDNVKKGLVLFASSTRNYIETNNLFKEQILLASDDQIKDAKTFEEKFLSVGSRIGQKSRERDAQHAEGKKLLGL